MNARNIWSLERSAMRGQERRAQATVSYMGIAQGDFVLDVGCGEGFVANHLLEAGFIVGIDTSKASLSIAKQNVRRSNVDFVQADATALPLRTRSFDKIMLLEVLEHLPEQEQRTVCNEINRVLRKDGTFLISAPYKEQITYTHIRCGISTPLWGHICSLDEQRISQLLPTGYSLIDCCHIPNVPVISLSRLFEHLPLRPWLTLNGTLGRIRKGYWIILKYRKAMF